MLLDIGPWNKSGRMEYWRSFLAGCVCMGYKTKRIAWADDTYCTSRELRYLSRPLMKIKCGYLFYIGASHSFAAFAGKSSLALATLANKVILLFHVLYNKNPSFILLLSSPLLNSQSSILTSILPSLLSTSLDFRFPVFILIAPLSLHNYCKSSQQSQKKK